MVKPTRSFRAEEKIEVSGFEGLTSGSVILDAAEDYATQLCAKLSASTGYAYYVATIYLNEENFISNAHPGQLCKDLGLNLSMKSLY